MNVKWLSVVTNCKARFLLVDLRVFCFIFRVVGTKKNSSENDQLIGLFQSFFYSELLF